MKKIPAIYLTYNNNNKNRQQGNTLSFPKTTNPKSSNLLKLKVKKKFDVVYFKNDLNDSRV